MFLLVKSRAGKEKSENSVRVEADLYSTVEEFFGTEKECKKIGSALNPIALTLFGGTIYPDVFGVSSPFSSNFEIFMAEGKRFLTGRSFDECKGQAISLQRFADYVYLFFPESAWNQLDETEIADIKKECVILKLGLLAVNEDSCKEILAAYPNPDLLKEENRIIAKDKIIQFFPDFLEPLENVSFFDKYSKLADTIIKESCRLLNECLEVFREATPVKKQSIKPWYKEDTFEFYLYAEIQKRPTVEALVIVKPFGLPEFKTKSPTLLIQQRYKYVQMKKFHLLAKLAGHIDKYAKRGCLALAEVDDEYIQYFDGWSAKEIFEDIKNSSVKDWVISVFEQIEILGVEKQKIKEDVEEALHRINEFSKTLKRLD